MGKVFLVDDDDAVRSAVSLLLMTAGHDVVSFDSAESFLKAKDTDGPACLVLDLRMPGLSGLDLQARLKEAGRELAIVFLSGHGNVPAAARALRSGAVDFIEKPFAPELLVERVGEALQRATQDHVTHSNRQSHLEKWDSLTPREREVLELVANGKANKVIALDLEISERTVELHRARGMKKMALRSAAELTQVVLAIRDC